MTNISEDTRKYRFALDLQTFSDDPEPTPDPEPKTVTMTQDELDALIAKRIGQTKRQYADYDEVKTKLSEFESAESERQKAAMTESERIQAELSAAKQAAEEAEGKSAAAIKAANERIIKADFKLAANSVNIRPDALEDAFLLADKAGISVGEDGAVIGVKEALDALVAAKPYLVEVVAPNKPKQIGDPNNPSKDNQRTNEQLLAEAAEKARKSGRLEDQAAYAKLKRELAK